MDPHPDAIQFLATHPPFAGVEATTMKTIASRCRPRSRRSGESLFLEGDPCRDLYILVAGRVKCRRTSREGREQDDLSLKTATTRVAKLLWERARAEGGREGEEVRLRRVSLREDDIAAMVGTVRVHVSRSLKALATMGAITLDRNTIGISDLKALESFLHAVEPGS